MSIFKTPTPAYQGSGQPQPDQEAGLLGFLSSLCRTPTPAYKSGIVGVTDKKTKAKAERT